MMNANLPEKYLDELSTFLTPWQKEKYLASFQENRTFGLRVNRYKCDPKDIGKLLPFPLLPIPWTENGFYYEENVNPANYPLYRTGLYYLQEPSAMSAAQILPIEQGDFVLDGCAAPGGKATELADRLNGSGALIVNDLSFSRNQASVRNLEYFGVKNAYVISEDLLTLSQRFPETFDKILLDVPCSGQGMFRKEPSLISAYEKKGSKEYAPLQKELLAAGLKMLKKGGMLLYSTCTFAPEEDEEVVSSVLSQDISLVDIPSFPGFCDGLFGLKECKRLYPFELKGEGHFLALLLKKGKKTKTSFSQEKAILKDEFFKHMHIDTASYQIEQIKDRLYLKKRLPIDLKGIRVLRSGLFLGIYEHERFTPSSAVAFALRKEDFDQYIDLSSSDIRVQKYLKGETIFVEGNKKKGYILVCCDGLPMGFGIWEDGRIKNKLEKGFRIV